MESDLSPLVLTSDPRHFNLQSVETGDDRSLQSHCGLELERHYDLIPSVVCALCCFFGVTYSFFGYRCFKAIMFLSGLLFGSAVIFLLCYKERILDTQLSMEVSAGIALGIGVLCGLVTMLVRSVGLFMTGLLLGLLVASAALLAMEQFYHPHTVWVPIGFLMGLAMLFAVLTLQWQKLFTVISTATFGAAIIVVCVDYFVELLVLAHYMYDRVRVARSEPLCWYSWVILGVWPVLSILGIVVQWRITAEGFSHTDVILSHRQKRLQLLRIHQQEVKKRKNMVPHDVSYRRKANPPKRYTGDILAPSYIQSLRERQTGTGTSLSSLGTNIQSVIDLDYDCGSTVPLTASAPAARA
ncbi:transmembrane protein 198-like [Rhinatrema bivittatum]|uniref:transmembrane protein 198-like n=1 Tax=Rhinatrema bivittatum TaxID=194408 RepID=UPI00112AAFAD|nr:transmembrane protein 198-like [Rhinatrema bivittatum]XP_029450662.1 transmembrane protein 198-like [Rhinatrema bivittatum]XP_029450663.1 transmembrane protein 198-like [Rhinatrema bivittatum]